MFYSTIKQTLLRLGPMYFINLYHVLWITYMGCVVCEGAFGHILKLNEFNLNKTKEYNLIIMYRAMRKALLIMSVCFVRLMNSFCHRQVTAMAERVVINEG